MPDLTRTARAGTAAPLSVAVTAVRVRAADEPGSAQLAMRDELLALLTIPGELRRLAVTGGSDVDGMPTARCELSTGDEQTLEAVLAPSYETTAVTDQSIGARWSLVYARPPIGFSAAPAVLPEACPSVRFEPEERADAEDCDRWYALAAEHPGVVLKVDVSRGSSAGRFDLRCSVFGPAPLPLRIRAFLADRFPGFELQPDLAPTTLEVDREAARILLPLPVGPAAGFAIAAPPVLPVRMRHGGVPGPFRLGAALLPSGRRVDVGLDETELSRHVHVVGHTGTGKSTALAALMHAFAARGLGFTLLDPHGSLVGRCLSELPASALGRTWLIQSADLGAPVPINPLAVDDDRFETALQDLVLVFYRLFDPGRTGIVGPRFESYLTHGVRGLRALRNRPVSLLDLPRLFQDRALERAVAAAVTDPREVSFWRGEMGGLSDSSRSEIVGWITAKFDRFANTAAMRAVLGSGEDAYDVADAMDENRIVLVDLSKGALGEVAADLLGFLHLSRLWSGFQRRSTDRPYGVFVDEVQSFTAGSLPAMLSEGRKRGASVVLAHQFLGQLDGDLAAAIEGNVATTMAFRSSHEDAARLRRRMGGEVHAVRFTAAADFTATVHRSAAGWTASPHTLLVDHSERVVHRSAQASAAVEGAVRSRTREDLIEPSLRRARPQDEEPTRSDVLEAWMRQRRRSAPAHAAGS